MFIKFLSFVIINFLKIIDQKQDPSQFCNILLWKEVYIYINIYIIKNPQNISIKYWRVKDNNKHLPKDFSLFQLHYLHSFAIYTNKFLYKKRTCFLC